MAAQDGAAEIIKRFLTKYGLASLGDWALKIYIKAGGGNVGLDAITAELPNTEQFKARFPAYDALAKAGKAMSIDEMLAYEQTARQIFHAAGIPPGFYDSPKDFAQFMIHDVSAAELETRVQDAQKAMISSAQDVRNQLHRLYGVDHGHLTAFFLNPDKAEPLIAQKFAAAQIASEAGRTAYGQLTRQMAEHLAKLGITDAQAQQGFAKLAAEKGLFQEQVLGEGSIGGKRGIAAEFEGNAAAQKAFEERAAKRLASFKQDSGFQVTQGGVGGLAPAQRGS